MRQRKLKNQEQKLIAYRQCLIEKPEDYKGRWREIFENENEIYVEFGCGKGKFITALAEKFPNRNFIGIEGQGSVILRALEKSEDRKLANICFIHAFIKDIREYFEPGELAGIYLNFSDPWPKKRHMKRRLTSVEYLEGYKEVLKPWGIIECKTDNEELFKFTLESLLSTNIEVVEQTEDLHGSSLEAKEIMTEYEEKFRRWSRKILYCKAKTPGQ